MHATNPVVNVGLSQIPSNHQSSCLLLQLYRPLLARHPLSVRVEAGIRGILEPEVLRRPDWDFYERSERERGKEKGGHTEPCPRAWTKDLLPVSPHVAEPPHIALTPNTAPLGVPRSPRTMLPSATPPDPNISRNVRPERGR